VKKIIVS